jgi:hypothetical protein
MDRREGEVAAGRTDQRGKQRVAREVVLERHLQREDRAGRGRLEDRRDTGGGARHEQRAPLPPHHARQTLVHLRADGGSEVDRRPFEPHRSPAAQRRDRRDHSGDAGAHAHRMRGVMERLDVLIRGSRPDAAPDPSQRCAATASPTGRSRAPAGSPSRCSFST